MKKLTTILLFILVSVAGCFAQNAASWRMNVKMTSKTEGTIIMKAVLEPGWHIYGTNLPKGGPTATTLDFNESKGIKLVGKAEASSAPIKGKDTMFNMELSWWEGSVTFRQKFKITGKGDPKAVCKVRYMTCNNRQCSMPKTETLTKPISK